MINGKTAIIAIGTANPEYKRDQQETAELVCESLNLRGAKKRLLRSVYKATGITSRYSVLPDYTKNPGEFEFFPRSPLSPFPTTAARMKLYKETALQLAIAAVNNCLHSLNDFYVQDITHVITVSCTGMYAPGLDIEIVQHFKLNPSTHRTVINFMGCYGAFNGMKVADAICKADPHAKVLLVCVELCSIHFQNNSELDNLISNAIFSDGCGAVIIQSNSENTKCFSMESFHCDLLPQTQQEMTWHIADSGFDIVLSSYVPEVIKSGIPIFIEKLLKKSEWTLADIDFFAIHPGGLKILQACEEALQITAEDNEHSYAVLRDYGNMSSATIIFVLKKIWENLQKNDNQKNILSCAFGPGLTLESMLLKTYI